MSLIRYALDGNYKRFYGNIKKIAKQEHRWTPILCLDMAYCTWRYKSGLSDYLNYEFYHKKHAERKEYVTIGVADRYHEITANIKYAPYFSYKPNFLSNFKEFISRDWYTPKEGIEALKDFLKTHEVFMIKPAIGLGGGGVQKGTTKEITSLSDFYQTLKKDDLFLDSYIVQHPDMEALAPASVNTIRVMTSGVGGKSRILFAAIRIGNGKNCADNFHQGGMSALIDMNTGKLVGNAFDKDLNEFEKHPLTHIKIDGYQIPYWQEVKDICLKAALVNQEVNAIGWDVAITKEGPTFIEGNRGPGYDLVQILSKRGRKDILRSVLAEVSEQTGKKYKI